MSLATERELRLPDGGAVRIRRAVPDDAGAVLRYLRQVGGETDNLTFGSEGPNLSESEEREYLARVGESDNSLAVVATVGDAIVGSLTFDGGHRPRLRHAGEFGISVAQAYAGLGIGRALIGAVWCGRSISRSGPTTPARSGSTSGWAGSPRGEPLGTR
jgi:GNAT superfamily N-acetyltransferase